MNTLRWYVIQQKDEIVNEIEQIYMTLEDSEMNLLEISVCWHYLEQHYYYNNHYGET